MKAVRGRYLLAGFSVALVVGCEPASDVQVQELPSLEQLATEERLGLPLVAGSWRFAGWELARGDTAGLEAELPDFGTLHLNVQKRDSLGGTYLASDGAAAPLSGEVRRNGVVALVAFPGGGAGRYLVGQLAGDTLWVESSTLGAEGNWRRGARAAFLHGEEAVTAFRRVHGAPVVAQAQPDTLAPPVDSLALGEGVVPAPVDPVGATPPVSAPAPAPVAAAPTEPAEEPVSEVEPETEVRPIPEVQSPQPVIERRDPPRVLGVPIERDDEGGPG